MENIKKKLRLNHLEMKGGAEVGESPRFIISGVYLTKEKRSNGGRSTFYNFWGVFHKRKRVKKGKNSEFYDF